MKRPPQNSLDCFENFRSLQSSPAKLKRHPMDFTEAHRDALKPMQTSPAFKTKEEDHRLQRNKSQSLNRNSSLLSKAFPIGASRANIKVYSRLRELTLHFKGAKTPLSSSSRLISPPKSPDKINQRTSVAFVQNIYSTTCENQSETTERSSQNKHKKTRLAKPKQVNNHKANAKGCLSLRSGHFQKEKQLNNPASSFIFCVSSPNPEIQTKEKPKASIPCEKTQKPQSIKSPESFKSVVSPSGSRIIIKVNRK